jgi:hypothetical protein
VHVAAEHLPDILLREPGIEQSFGDEDQTRHVEGRRDGPVEVRAERDVVWTGDLDGMANRRHDAGRADVAQRGVEERDPDDPAVARHCPELCVRQVAGPRTGAADSSMRHDNRARREGQRVVERGRRRVREIDGDAKRSILRTS